MKFDMTLRRIALDSSTDVDLDCEINDRIGGYEVSEVYMASLFERPDKFIGTLSIADMPTCMQMAFRQLAELGVTKQQDAVIEARNDAYEAKYAAMASSAAA